MPSLLKINSDSIINCRMSRRRETGEQFIKNSLLIRQLSHQGNVCFTTLEYRPPRQEKIILFGKFSRAQHATHHIFERANGIKYKTEPQVIVYFEKTWFLTNSFSRICVTLLVVIFNQMRYDLIRTNK